jgi:predicted GH43/DUF377 family glycosyl hydrolase
VKEAGLATRTDVQLRADVTRVITRLFIPGQELIGGSESRTSSTVQEVLALSEDAVDAVMADLFERFSGRHDDLAGLFEDQAQRVIGIVGEDISPRRRQLLGAAFTHEYSIEGAAICNPSLVKHPDQTGVAPGGLRIVLSLRAIGEGHKSTIGFRAGEIAADHSIRIEEPKPFPVLAETRPTSLNRDVFHASLRDLGLDGETATSVLDRLPLQFSREELNQSLDVMVAESDVRIRVAETAALLRSFTDNFYSVTFNSDAELCQRVLWPATLRESQGMEDARFVEVDFNGRARYIASYTAYDGVVVSQQLLETNDFVTFRSSPLTGVAAQNKGMAFFPRQIRGRYAALSRFDREHNAVTFSDNLSSWDDVTLFDLPAHTWEMLQVGNCGSPIELDVGWLVLTHGVGPMRTYAIGAMLLDLEDPTKVLGALSEPLLAPSTSERDGYVPNVVYSCGSLVHQGVLYVPFGASDQFIGCATVDVSQLVESLRS